MKKSYSILKPINSNTLRLTFGFNNPLEKKVNPFEIMEPAINHFEKFAIGRYFWFIVDLRNWITVCGGGELESMTSLKKENFFNDDHHKIYEITYSDDIPHVTAFSRYWVNYYLSMPLEHRPYSKMTIYFRIKNAMNNYYWIMVQYSDAIFDSDGNFVYGLVFATDISHLKKEGVPMMSILDTYDGNCQQFFCSDLKNLTKQNLIHNLSTREREVLQHLAMGCSSKQIASQLNLSVKTIDNHRQNMLHKTNSKSTAELVAYSITNGFL
ncbi:MAG: response regulator transcription factor [Chitinophagaceae bacterium]